jgi:hypothetical protein
MHIIFQFALSGSLAEHPSSGHQSASPSENLDAAQSTEAPSCSDGSIAEGISHVIIKKEFSDLESTIQRLFRDLPAVNIFVDRRWHDRRALKAQTRDPTVPEQRDRRDRRQAVPAFEVLVPLAQGMLG